MTWTKMLAYISRSVDDMLLKKVEYLLAENRILRGQLEKRVKLTDSEKKTLAEKAVALGSLMADTVIIVKTATILNWHQKLVAQKFDGSKNRKIYGRPRLDAGIEALIIQLAKENRSWGYDINRFHLFIQICITVFWRNRHNLTKLFHIQPQAEFQDSVFDNSLIKTEAESLGDRLLHLRSLEQRRVDHILCTVLYSS